MRILLFFTIIIFPFLSYSQDWKTIANERLFQFGHRNWIVVADAAYPKQSAMGIETVYTGADQIDVLEYVLNVVNEAKHVRPVIVFDAELKLVTEKNASGVEQYRKELKQLLGESTCKEMPHKNIIDNLDEASGLFNILVLKTNMTIPYTSVFVELDCGYWSVEKETELRDLIRQSNQ